VSKPPDDQFVVGEPVEDEVFSKMMPARSDSAAGVNVTLRFDEITDGLSESGVFERLAFDRAEALARRLDDLSLAFLLFTDRQFGTEPRQFLLALFEELDGFVDDVAGVGVVARGDEFFDSGFDLW
jgi:hypothetical protein